MADPNDDRSPDMIDYIVHLPSGGEVQLPYTRVLQIGDTFARGGEQWKVQKVQEPGDDPERHIWVEPVWVHPDS